MNNNAVNHTDPTGHGCEGIPSEDGRKACETANNPAPSGDKCVASNNYATGCSGAQPQQSTTGVQTDTGGQNGSQNNNEKDYSNSSSQDNADISTILLYRAVGDGEFNDIMNTGLFRPDPNGLSMDFKWFWTKPESAEKFMDIVQNATHIVQAEVPDTALDEASYSAENLDSLGQAVAFGDEALDWLNTAILDLAEFFP